MVLKRFLTLIFLFIPLFAFAEEFVAGKDYEIIHNDANPKKAAANIVTVTEFFSYGCPWCYKIDSSLMGWVKQQGDTIQFSRVPVVFNKDWLFYAKAYYTAKLLRLDDKFGPLLFKAIQAKPNSLNSNEAMVAFFTTLGVDNSTAKSAFENSTTIDMQVTEGIAQMTHYHITGVPAIVINNQYKTDLQMAHTDTRFLKILDFLLKKSSAANGQL